MMMMKASSLLQVAIALLSFACIIDARSHADGGLRGGELTTDFELVRPQDELTYGADYSDDEEQYHRNLGKGDKSSKSKSKKSKSKSKSKKSSKSKSKKSDKSKGSKSKKSDKSKGSKSKKSSKSKSKKSDKSKGSKSKSKSKKSDKSKGSKSKSKSKKSKSKSKSKKSSKSDKGKGKGSRNASLTRAVNRLNALENNDADLAFPTRDEERPEDAWGMMDMLATNGFIKKEEIEEQYGFFVDIVNSEPAPEMKKPEKSPNVIQRLSQLASF